MSKLLDLAERCEQATGPDRELDSLIAEACGVEVKRRPKYRRGHYIGGQPVQTGWKEDPPKFTASLDAAMTLVPEGWRKRMLDSDEWRCICEVWNDDTDEEIGVQAATWPLALCAAALCALSSRDSLTEVEK